MTYTSQHTPPWRAFVGTPKKSEEWTREMDWAIGWAVGEIRPEITVVNGVPLQIMAPLRYSTDLEAVVRAADKWCDQQPIPRRSWEFGKAENGVYAMIASAPGFHTEICPTPALALAKALYAAIRAEGEKKPKPVNTSQHRVEEKQPAWAEQYNAQLKCHKCGQVGCKCTLGEILADEISKMASGERKGPGLFR